MIVFAELNMLFFSRDIDMVAVPIHYPVSSRDNVVTPELISRYSIVYIFIYNTVGTYFV